MEEGNDSKNSREGHSNAVRTVAMIKGMVARRCAMVCLPLALSSLLLSLFSGFTGFKVLSLGIRISPVAGGLRCPRTHSSASPFPELAGRELVFPGVLEASRVEVRII